MGFLIQSFRLGHPVSRMKMEKWPSWWLLFAYVGIKCAQSDEKYNAIHKDGSFEFSYDTPDAFHVANGNRNNVVRGQFGGRNPETGLVDKTTYTAGPRGYRPRGKNVARKYDLSQVGPRAVGSNDDPYFDPYEDPSYNFAFKTRTYSREENANRFGDVKGSYTYVDDVGERHNVDFIAGKRTGFHVRTPFPDSNPQAYGPLFFNGRGKPIPRGRTAIQRGLDGSYKFISAGPDQRRTETSDATGHVRGSYTYLDDKGVQHSVHYIAGPETGYRVLKNVKGPHLPTIYPFSRPDIIPPDYYDSFDKAEKELFDTAASGRPGPKPAAGDDEGDSEGGGGAARPPGGGRRPTPRPPQPSPADENEDAGEDIDLFGGAEQNTPGPVGGEGETYKPPGRDDDEGLGSAGEGGGGGTTYRPPSGGSTYRPSTGGFGGGTTYRPASSGPSYKPSSEEGGYGGGTTYRPASSRPSYKPSSEEGGYGGGTTYRPTSSRPSYKPSSEEGGYGGGTTYRPSSSRPSYKPSTESGYGGTTSGAEDDGSYRPSKDEGAYNPQEQGGKPDGGGFGSGTFRPTTEQHQPSEGGYGSTQSPGTVGSSTEGSRPGQGRPSRPPFAGRPQDFASEGDDDGFNLFGSEASRPVGRPGKPPRPQFGQRPTGQADFEDQGGSPVIGVAGGGFDDRGSRVPSPSEQYQAETTVQSEASKIVSTTVKTTTARIQYDDDEDIFK